MNFEELAEEYQNAKPRMNVMEFQREFPRFFSNYGIETISICDKTFFKGRNYWKQLTDNLFTLSATRSSHIIHKYLPPERNEDGREKARFTSIYPDIPVTRKIIIKKIFGLGLYQDILNESKFNDNYLIEFEVSIDDEDNISIYPNITKEEAKKNEDLFKIFSYFERALSYDKFNLNLDNLKFIFNNDLFCDLSADSDKFSINFDEFDSLGVSRICDDLKADLAIIPSDENTEQMTFLPRQFFWETEFASGSVKLSLPSFTARKSHFNPYITLELKGVNNSPKLDISFVRYKYNNHKLKCRIRNNDNPDRLKLIGKLQYLIKNNIHSLHDFHGLLKCDINKI